MTASSSSWQKDLTEEAAIYGSYHSNFWNIVLHIIFVPTILFGFALWLAVPLPVPAESISHFLPAWAAAIAPAEAFVPNVAMIPFTLMCLYYSTLDVLVATILWMMLIGFAIASNAILGSFGMYQVFLMGLALQIIGWGTQVIVGHGYFEGRKPAVTDSPFQSIVSPFFVVLELLFAVGYRPKLQAEIHDRTQRKLEEWRQQNKKVL